MLIIGGRIIRSVVRIVESMNKARHMEVVLWDIFLIRRELVPKAWRVVKELLIEILLAIVVILGLWTCWGQVCVWVLTGCVSLGFSTKVVAFFKIYKKHDP